jgi:hypothetical protein
MTAAPLPTPPPSLEAITVAADQAAEGLSDAAGVELQMRREGREGRCR